MKSTSLSMLFCMVDLLVVWSIEFPAISKIPPSITTRDAARDNDDANS